MALLPSLSCWRGALHGVFRRFQLFIGDAFCLYFQNPVGAFGMQATPQGQGHVINRLSTDQASLRAAPVGMAMEYGSDRVARQGLFYATATQEWKNLGRLPLDGLQDRRIMQQRDAQRRA